MCPNNILGGDEDTIESVGGGPSERVTQNRFKVASQADQGFYEFQMTKG